MKYLFLDLDNTVSASRQKVDPRMKEALSKFPTVIVVSGAEESQMRYQLDGLSCETLSQNGNVNPLWERRLTQEEVELIDAHIRSYTTIEDDQYENRGAQISYSFTGHHAPLDLKKAFDPTGDKRAKVLNEHPLPKGIEARIGGTTCIDYFPKGLNKGANIKRFIQERGWATYDCLYVGDALFPGGNDETVIGIIPTFPVHNWEDSLTLLT